MDKVIVEDNGLEIENIKTPMYSSKKPLLSFISKDNRAVCRSVTCKDYLHDMVRAAYEGKLIDSYNPHGYDPKTCPKLSFSQLKLGFWHEGKKDTVSDSFGRGLAILNKFEEHAGIKKSTAELIKQKSVGKYGILLKGSSIYMRNPHLLALAVLVIRFNLMVELDIEKVRTAADAANVMYEKAKDLLGKTNYTNDDRSMMKVTAKYMPYILKRRKSIFRGIPSEILYRKNELKARSSFHSSGGILSLVTCCTRNKVLDDRIKRIKKKLNFKE